MTGRGRRWRRRAAPQRAGGPWPARRSGRERSMPRGERGGYSDLVAMPGRCSGRLEASGHSSYPPPPNPTRLGRDAASGRRAGCLSLSQDQVIIMFSFGNVFFIGGLLGCPVRPRGRANVSMHGDYNTFSTECKPFGLCRSTLHCYVVTTPDPSPRPSPARGEGGGCTSVMPAGSLCHARRSPTVMPAGFTDNKCRGQG